MKLALRRLVWRRAMSRCEYCRAPASDSCYPFEIDHIRARKHRGLTVESNLALSCFFCNCNKGSDIASFDPRTGRLSRLFNPRSDRWEAHFQNRDGVIHGRTPIGRTTVFLLRMNEGIAIEFRRDSAFIEAFEKREFP